MEPIFAETVYPGYRRIFSKWYTWNTENNTKTNKTRCWLHLEWSCNSFHKPIMYEIKIYETETEIWNIMGNRNLKYLAEVILLYFGKHISNKQNDDQTLLKLLREMTIENIPKFMYTIHALFWLVRFVIWSPGYQHGLTLIPAWISNCIHYNVWDVMTSHTSTVGLLKFGNGK